MNVSRQECPLHPFDICPETGAIGVRWSEAILPSTAKSRGFGAVIINVTSDAKESISPRVGY